jgi:hypothetical protein
MASLPQDQAPAPNPAEMVDQVGQGLTSLVEMVTSSPQTDDADKQKAQALLAAYEDFVGGLSQSPGEAPAPEAAGGVVPAMAGSAKVRPAL